jgi:uncharacterized protein (DUF1697 family)
MSSEFPRYTHSHMPVIISMLRGVNVGGRGKIKMDALRALYESLDLKDVQTFIQSGNVVFRTTERSLPKLSARLEDAIEKKFGFRPPVILRTVEQFRELIARNPFAARPDIHPGKLLVWFLAAPLSKEATANVLAIKTDPRTEPEELHICGNELFVYFPNGQGRPKLSWPAVEKAMKVSGTGRNWNSVMKLLDMAEKTGI